MSEELFQLRVWAPYAHRQVEVLTGGKRYPMRPETNAASPTAKTASRDAETANPTAKTASHSTKTANHTAETYEPGWWVCETGFPAGTRYQFSLDGGMPLPDPRSRRQPEGAHGPSEIVDTAQFEFSDFAGVDPLGKVFYELHIGTFTPEGTFAAAAEKLPYLRDLGVDVVELLPIQPVPGRWNWGYDGVDLYAVTENYGGPAGFAAFVEAAHQAGLAVCLDVVYNHFGADGNYIGQFGPYFTETHHTPWGAALNFDGPESGPVRRFFIENAVQWARDYRVDMFRLDAVHAIIDDSPRHILAELSDALKAFGKTAGRTIGLIAESDINDPAMVESTARGGYGMDIQWTDDIHHALHVASTGETQGYYADFGEPGALEKALRHVFVHDGVYSTFRKKLWGQPVPETTDSRRFLIYTENHDQVGNRATGDRRTATISPGAAAAADAVAALSPFSYMLFQGQEWAASSPFQFFTDHGPELAPKVVQGRIEEFKDWDWQALTPAVPSPQEESTFYASQLNWEEAERGEHAKYLRITRELLRLRREVPDFANANRADSEIVRLGRAGYYRRGNSYIVFNFVGPATVTLPGTLCLPATVPLPTTDFLAPEPGHDLTEAPTRGADDSAGTESESMEAEREGSGRGEFRHANSGNPGSGHAACGRPGSSHADSNREVLELALAWDKPEIIPIPTTQVTPVTNTGIQGKMVENGPAPNTTLPHRSVESGLAATDITGWQVHLYRPGFAVFVPARSGRKPMSLGHPR
ncbi:glycogen branching protein [Actinobaculum suis]|uniref:Malto-oligosyltrehalose trehalohydrolase n=1 Tax=Actinobaculum suis TaxID=1657 RepID=A0A7Z8YA99_9ACTO|nr:malto-oligosyltrehalose trehalohydrolase [Actinobaculum suis]VDG76608.1 glycogen branching protein [Actinobaculum suis]